MKIVFIGNFQVPYSTESHHLWTWRKLGHEVIALQEQTTTTEAVLAACQGAQVLQWTHTHGWPLGGQMSPEEMLFKVKQAGVVSFSYHLDVYFGLNTLDRRADRVGTHPSWKVDHFFSTDGAHEAEYAARGVNHHWLPAGVVEYGCYKGDFTSGLASDIGFVGSTGYHPEYPYRTRMVNELKAHYGNRFRVYTGMREAALNNTYASIKVVVGDHCFAGMPFYWSDRLPESAGRGAFIVYPATQGLEEYVSHGLATYEPQNTRDLMTKIDYFLDPAHEAERIERRNSLHEYIKANHTYTQRLQTVLNITGVR